MTRKDSGFLLVLMVLSGLVGAAFNSWLTETSPAYAQPVHDGAAPYEATRYGADDRSLDDVREQLRKALENSGPRKDAPELDQQLALPNGVVTARALQFTDEAGDVQCILTSGKGPKGLQIILMDASRQIIWSAPDSGGVRFVQ